MSSVPTSPNARPVHKEHKRPGAREFEKLARTDCVRQTAIVLNEFNPAFVAESVLDGDAREGLSPIAQGAGKAFERWILDDNAGLLLSAYREKGWLKRSDVGVVNTEDIAPTTDPARSTKRLAFTRQILRDKLRGRSPYALVRKPLLAITVSGREYTIEPDYLVASSNDCMFRVGEIKSYYDLDGLTDSEDMRGAIRQAAVGHFAVRETLIGFGLDRSTTNALLPTRVDLVLRQVGTRMPSLRNMSVRGEFNSVLRAIHSFDARLADMHAALAASHLTLNLKDAVVIRAIPHSFRPDCRNFCALYSACRKEAVGRGDLATLGPATAAHLTAAGSVRRALELLNGALPRSPEEATLQVALCTTDAELRRACSA